MSPATGAPISRTRRISDGLRSIRNRLLSSQKFQSAATSFPLTRPIAQRHASDLFQLCTGFVNSQVLLACVQLDLFNHLRLGPLSIDQIMARTQLPQDGAERLLKAAVALKLIAHRSDGRYDLGDLGAALLGNPSVFAMIRHHGDFYADLTDPVDLLKQRSRDTRIAKFWGYAGSPAPDEEARDSATDYSALMSETQGFIAADVLTAYPMDRHRHLMDIGGGSGAFVTAVANAVEGMDLTLCDLPPVAALAENTLRESGLLSRVNVRPLDMIRDPWPKDADLITLVRILHDHDDEPVRQILASARASLPKDGRLLIAEPMAGTPGAEAMGDAYFGLYLWAMGSGRPRRADELSDMLRDAGFSAVYEVKTRQPLLVRCLVAEP